MHFEFDPAKSTANQSKHGIDFVAAQALWEDTNMLEVPAKVIGENRHLVIGKIEGKLWSAVITYRKDTIRIISVRRSRKEEIEAYETIGF